MKITEAKVSIQATKNGCKIGCFDEFDCIRDFIFYIDEGQGIEDASRFFKKLGVDEFKIVRPKITKMVLRS